MPELTITDTKGTEFGYSFIRSDGRHFFMVIRENGAATVHAGIYGKPPQVDISSLDVNVADKVEAAKALILAYRD
jgi:hypothetical protein